MLVRLLAVRTQRSYAYRRPIEKTKNKPKTLNFQNAKNIAGEVIHRWNGSTRIPFNPPSSKYSDYMLHTKGQYYTIRYRRL